MLPLAGPLALIAIIATWTLGLVLGWAVIYWPHLPGGFLLATGLDPDSNDALLDALIGFALFTAAISWILSVYPVLGRRRHLAREVALLQRVRSAQGLGAVQGAPAALEGTLLSLAEQANAIRGDLEQLPITYYFHPSDRESALPVALPDLLALAREGQHHESSAVQLQSKLLLKAIHDPAGHVGGTFLDRRGVDVDALLAAYAEDHSYRMASRMPCAPQ
jgi:hypothetical protein